MPSNKKRRTIEIPSILDNIDTTKVLVALLIVAAFFIGTLYSKVQHLEKGATAPTPVAGTQPTVPGQLAPGEKVDVKEGHLPLLGNKDAKVTVIEFADFQCPFCKQWFDDTSSQLIKEYVDTGKVKFAFRHYAFLGQESTWAAQASECANDQGKFWEYHDYLYTHQGAENSGAFNKDKLEGFAQQLGLNVAEFKSCLESDKHADKVAQDLSEGQQAGVSGTPTVFVNGMPLVGAQPYATLKQLVDQELAK